MIIAHFCSQIAPNQFLATYHGFGHYYSSPCITHNSLVSLWGIYGSKLRHFVIAHFESLIAPNTLPNKNSNVYWPCRTIDICLIYILHIFLVLFMHMGQNGSWLEQGSILLKINPKLPHSGRIALQTWHIG